MKCKTSGSSDATTDQRKRFDGLFALVQQVFHRDPRDGHLFPFLSRGCDRVQILWWDRDGLALDYKPPVGRNVMPVYGSLTLGQAHRARQAAARGRAIDATTAIGNWTRSPSVAKAAAIPKLLSPTAVKNRHQARRVVAISRILASASTGTGRAKTNT